GAPNAPTGPPTGAIAYLMADSPMGPWTPQNYAGVIFKNPGNYFGAGGNNHQSVFELGGEYYFTYHAQTLNRRITGGATQGFRSPHIAKLGFNADGTVKEVVGTYDGVEQIRHLDPYRVIEAETIAWQQGLATKRLNAPNDVPRLALHDVDAGDWTSLSSADFGTGATGVSARVKPLAEGTSIQVRLDDRAGPVVATIPVDGPVGEWTEVGTDLHGVSGVHDVYFTFAGPADRDLVEVDSWRFTAPSLDVAGAADTRCAGPNVQLVVRVTDNESVPVDIAVDTPYGSKSFKRVQPGAARSHPFTTRERAVPAGSVTVTATAVVDGKPQSRVLDVPYAARTCR
ncbi:carbohydrate-binding protein, partial [Actinosynnema sp. NPDC023658]|uniref:carbohydrate-binding protein n=1 Tax=Actinosynnema sp. NPDC023658 TaxID=3155465 RepID=UPI0033E937F7